MTERMHITIKEDVHQKSIEQVDKEDDTIAEITKEGEVR
jgi:hypothetical protein